MYRLLLFWLPYLKTYRGLAALNVAAAVALCWVLRLPVYAVPPVAGAGFALCFSRWWWHLLRFGIHTWRFRTLDGKAARLRYAPGLETAVNLPEIQAACERALQDFTKQFGFPLKRRLVVYLFPTPAEFGRLFRMPMGGAALCNGDAFLLAVSGVTSVARDEIIRHELGHLFSSYWGTVDPPLKGEGLATWLMSTIQGRPVDLHALVAFIGGTTLFLPRLLHAGYFHGFKHESYAVAGSFTGYLIRRFGWEAYCDFFRGCQANTYMPAFARVFGASASVIEREWREELLARRERFEPELSRVVGEFRVESAYNAGHLLRCVEEGEALRRDGRASGKVLWYVAAAQYYLGRFGPAADGLREALRTDDDWVRAYRANAWLELGNISDLQGNRPDAREMYEHALAEPDVWLPPVGSIHGIARRYLQRPFTENDFVAKLLLPQPRPRRRKR